MQNGLAGIGQTIVDQAIRDNGKLSARWIHLLDTNAHGVQTLKSQLLGFVGQATKHLFDLVCRLERKSWKGHFHLLSRYDEAVDD